MSQGKLKVKSSLPKGVQRRSRPVLKREDRTAPRKAKPITEKQKIKAKLEKSTRAKIEEEMRARVSHGDGKPLATKSKKK
ncbi:uncharacterized protein LOC100901666 [Galendromus occidentalis]|uniref:Uncharacterized protein LOC100901666 n=1 Tax=Galendromus occidentalis TaxID=34638 RepID=A0AAJ7L8D8_9ACAR|nr:uncharacterized protein LOC100901666 [Galendromus occidentalis]